MDDKEQAMGEIGRVSAKVAVYSINAARHIGHLFGFVGLMYGVLALIVPLTVVWAVRVMRDDRRPSRTWTGWLIMGRTAFHLLTTIRPTGRLG